MSREQERDALRRLRAELEDSQRHHYGLNAKTVPSSSYQNTVQRSTRGNLDISSHRSIRDAANMPIFMEDTHKSNILSRDFNSGYDSNIQPSNIRSHTTQVSAALEALQNYGPVTQSSSSHSSMQRDWNIAFPKNINNPPEKLQAFLSSMLKSKDPNIQTYSAESSTMSTSDISCPPFSDLNLNNVDEEDEYLYGDSNSLPEMPQLLKNDSDQSNAKIERPGWSDDEDLFDESSVTSRNKSNLDQMKSSNVWSLQSKNIQLKLSQKLEGNTNDSSRNIPHEAYSVEQKHSSVSSAECQNVRDFLNKIPEKDVKNIMPEKDSKVTSTSSVKSKYHAAAQVLKQKTAEKSKSFASETTDFLSNYPANMKNINVSYKNDIQENKLTTKSNIPVKDSKELQVRKSGENVRRLPKAFLQKDLNTIADYIKPQRKRMHPREEAEYIKHPRHENYRSVSPNKDQSSRHKSPVDEHRHQSPYHSRHRSPESDLRYKMSHHYKSKSPHRDYNRHSHEYNARHNEGRWPHSRSPSRKSAEQSTRHYSYRARSPGSFRTRERSRSPRSFRSRERSRSPESFRSRERSRSPESFRSRERSRSPGYHRSGDRSHEHEHKKDSYKSKELSSKGEPRDSESRNRKKAQKYSSDDSLCTLSLESDSTSSDSSDDIQGKKEKSTAKPVTKEKRTDSTKSLKTDTGKIEKKALEDVCVKKADKSMLPDNISQNLVDMCNFQDKTSDDPSVNDIFKLFDNKGSGNDKLNTIVKMFENSHLVRELVEGVQEHVNSLTQPIPPPDAAHNTPEHINSVTHPIPTLDAAHNTPNLLTPNSFVPNVSFPNISSSEPYPIMPSVPIHFHPPPINSLPPLTFPPPPLVPQPVGPPPVIPMRVIPPPVPVSASTSAYGPFPVSLPSVDASRIPDTKQVKKRPTTLRPINITMDIPSPKSSKEHSQPSLVASAESKVKKIEKEKTASEAFAEQRNIYIETYKKLKTEKHYAHIKVNSCVADILEMRKIMDDTWGKKENPSDRVFYSRCKNMISASSNTMNECLKEAKRIDDELNRFKGIVPKKILDEIGNIKTEEPSKYGNVHYSCYDTSNHTCYLCCKPFPNLLSILEHLHSEEHKEQMTANDKDWTKKFKKPEKNKEDKNEVLQPVQGVEFMKPFTGYFCSLCSETLLDKASAEQHLKGNDHYCQYKDYNFKNPIYEKKIFFKKFIQRSILSKAKEKIKKQEREQQLKKAEEANEKVKDALKDQKNKEKIVEDLDDDDADPLSSKNQSSSGIKLNLSNDREKEKQNVKEGSKATKAPQRVVYIGKAPNFKARPKQQPWYKKDIYHKIDESPSQSTESIVPVVTYKKEKNSGNGREPSLSSKNSGNGREPSLSSKNSGSGREPSQSSNPDSLGDDIPEAVAGTKKAKMTSKKVTKASTCLTEEDSKKLGTSSNNTSLSCKEKSSTVSNDPTICSTDVESKNLNTSCDDLKNVSILSTENVQPVSGDSGSILNANASSKQSTSVQNTKDTFNQPGSPANENKDGTIAISKDSTVNQALKNILLGTDSSVQEIPLNEIRLPDTHDQNSSNTPTNSLLRGESNIPVPMEIEDTNDESVFNPHPKLTTEEDRDLYILGINREDLIPLAVPVPPPSSLLNSGSPSHSPAASSPRHNRNCGSPSLSPAASSPRHNLSSANNESKNGNESIGNEVISASASTDLNKLLNSKKKTLEYINNNSKYSKNSANLIILTDNTLESESLLKSDTVKTSVKFKNLITICETMESSDVNTNDVTAAVSTKSQDVNIESSVDIDTSKEDSIPQINETNLETTKAVPLETDSITEKSSQITDVSGSDENLNEVISSDNKFFKKEPDTNLNLIEAVAQDGVTERSSQISDVSKSNKNVNEVFSGNNENLEKEPDINLNRIEDVAEGKIVNQITSATDCVIAKSEQANSDSISISECKSSDSSSMADCVEINAKSLVVKDSDNGVFSGSIKLHDSNQNSDLEPAQKSADQNQVSNENNIPDMDVCASTNKTIPVKDELDDVQSTQDLGLGQSLNQDSSNEGPSKEVCKAVHMQDQESNIKPCQSLIIKQESPKENVSERRISPDILIRDQQSNSDIKSHQSSEAKQLLNNVSVNENAPDVEVSISENKAVISQQYIQPDKEVVSEQSIYQDSHMKSVSDMEVCETSPDVDQPSSSKPNLNLDCSNNSIFPMQSSEKNINTETVDVIVKEKVSEQLTIHTKMTFEKKYDELITVPSSADLPTEIISDTKISSSIPESADLNLTTSVNNSSDGILDSHSNVIPEQCLSKNVCSPEVVRMEIDSEQQAIFTEKKSQCDELITVPSSTDLPTEIISDTKISSSIPESSDLNLTTSVNNSSDGILDSHSNVIPEQCLSKNVCSPEVVRMEIDSEQQAIFTEKKSQCDELITVPSSTDLPTEIISDTKISSSIPESADLNLTTSVNNSSDGILDSHSNVIPEQCLSKNVCSPEVVRMEIDSEQQAIFTEKKSQCDELITVPSSTDLPTEIISNTKISSSIPESADLNLTTSVNNSSDGILDSHSNVIPEQCLSKNVCSPEVVRMEIDSEQQAVFTEKKSQCDVKSDQGSNLLHSLNQNLVAENTSDVTEAKLLQECHGVKKSNETEVVEDKICDSMSADVTEAKLLQECHGVKKSNETKVVEDKICDSMSADVTEVKLLQECHGVKKSNETEVVEDKICDSMSADSSHLISENLSENKSFEMDNKNLQLEPVLISVKSECEVTPSEGVISQVSSNQYDSTSEKTASHAVDTSSPNESVNEGSSSVSVTGESVSGQETTQQKLDVTLENIATVNKENEETLPDCNTSIKSQKDGTQTLPMLHSRVTRSRSRALPVNVIAQSSCSPSSSNANLDQENLPFNQSNLRADHAPLSPQSSVTSSGSGSDGQKDEKDVFSQDGTGMKDVSSWLKGLRLQKYSYIFKNMTYEEMMSITEEKLEKMNIAKGARRKIVLSIQKLRERQGNLKSLEKDIQEGEGTKISKTSCDEKEQAGSEINLKSPGLEENIAGDPQSKTQILSSSSGEVLETQNLPKSDTDTDEYENEE